MGLEYIEPDNYEPEVTVAVAPPAPVIKQYKVTATFTSDAVGTTRENAINDFLSCRSFLDVSSINDVREVTPEDEEDTEYNEECDDDY